MSGYVQRMRYRPLACRSSRLGAGAAVAQSWVTTASLPEVRNCLPSARQRFAEAVRTGRIWYAPSGGTDPPATWAPVWVGAAIGCGWADADRAAGAAGVGDEDAGPADASEPVSPSSVGSMAIVSRP